MLALSAGLLLVVAHARIDADADRVKKLFKGDHYTVEWGVPPVHPADAELEIGDGYGHGFTLGWVRFWPGRGGSDVLSVKFDEGFNPYDSKWPPDRAPVTVTAARMEPVAYSALLRDLAVVSSARPKRVGNQSTFSNYDYRAAARLTTGSRVLLDLDWAGYWTSQSEHRAAKPTAAVTLAQTAIKSLKFEKRALTAADRAWASERFARDWKRYKGESGCWWVAERIIVMVGVAGDDNALPTLRDILSNPADELGRQHYHAINAVTRLTGQDVRTKPVEEMDIEKVRPKVLELLKGKK